MNKSITLIMAGMLFSVVAAAQDIPRFETFVGYDFTRVNSATNIPAFSMNGGTGQFVVNFTHYFGFVADMGAVHNGNIGGYHLDTTMPSYLFGPRFAVRHWSRVTPYFQILWGGARASTSVGVSVPVGDCQPPACIVPPPVVTPLGSSSSAESINLRAVKAKTGFAMAVGGGIDLKISNHISFRPIELDYLLTRLQNFRTQSDNNQHDLRYMTGFNFRFGGGQ